MPRINAGNRELYDLANIASKRAHASVTGFKVGAVAMDAKGNVYLGANIETGTLSLSVHAESAAVIVAILDDAVPEKVVVAAATGEDLPPCGHCLQSMLELGIKSVVFRQGGELVEKTIKELLPHQFQFDPTPGTPHK